MKKKKEEDMKEDENIEQVNTSQRDRENDEQSDRILTVIDVIKYPYDEVFGKYLIKSIPIF